MARSYDRVCPCGKAFTATRPNARWHSAACKKAAQRAPKPAVRRPWITRPVRQLPEGLEHDVDSTALVTAVHTALEQAEKLDSWKGQQALAIARRLAHPDESGTASLSKELDRVMAAALADAAAQPAATAEATEPEDDVARARRARDEARQAAGLS